MTASSKKTSELFFPICALPHALASDTDVRRKALDEIAGFLQWSQAALDTGHWPLHGCYGETFKHNSKRGRCAGSLLAGGLRGHYAAWQGDLKARREVHDFRRHYQTGWCCDSCGACQLYQGLPRHLNYANFDASAGYTFTQMTHRTYVQIATPPSAWCGMRGFALESLFFDYMHVTLLGVDRDLGGSILVDLLERDLLPGDSPDGKLKSIWNEVRAWAPAHGISMPTGIAFSLSALGRGKSSLEFPSLPKSYKALSVRTLTMFFADYVYRQPCHDESAKWRRMATWGLAELHYVCNVGQLILSREEAQRAHHGIMVFLRAYLLLAADAMERGLALYKMRPKFHYLWHIAMKLTHCRINPGIVSCLRGEDILGQYKRVARKCHIRTVSHRFLTRWMSILVDDWGLRQKTHQSALHKGPDDCLKLLEPSPVFGSVWGSGSGRF